MRIVDVREMTLPISSAIANAYIDFSKMTCSLVAVVTDVIRGHRRVIGYGFNSNGRYGQGGLIWERFAPRLLQADPISLVNATEDNFDPDRIWQTLMRNEKPGGHGERSVAVGTIDMAVWDAVAKIADKPLFRLLAERCGVAADPRVFVYAAGGYYYPGKNLEALRAEMRSYLDRGYTVVKMKIGGADIAEDRRRVEAVLKELGDDGRLAVDANGRFDLETAIAYAKMLREYPLFWYEEAGDPLDYELQAALAQFYPGPMATGENLFSHQDARNLLRYGGLRPDRDWLQFDCALSYGLCEYLRTLEAIRAAGWSPLRCIPHGGHQMSLNIAAGLGLGGNESYPDLFQPFGGFPDSVCVEQGHVVMPELPGIGFEGKADLIGVMRELRGVSMISGKVFLQPSKSGSRSLLGPLWLQVIAGILLGIVIGILFPHTAIALKPLGDGFIKLIRMTLAPIIFATIVVGIARMGDIKEVGRVGAKSLLYFEVVSSLALLAGVIAAKTLHPGRGMNIDPASLDSSAIASYTANAQHAGFTAFLLNIIPSSVGGAFVDGNMLQIILLSVLFGMALTRFRTAARPLVDLLDLFLQAMLGIVNFIMYLAPLAALGSIAYTVGLYGIVSLLPLARFTAELWLISILFVAIVLGGIAHAAGFSLLKLIRYLREEILITAGTCSSEAVMAPLMVKLQRLGCAEPVVGMVLPAGYAFNADGTAIYLSMAALFLAQATNTHLSLRDQAVVMLVLMITSKGSAGITGTAFVILAATLASLHTIPIAGIVLLLGVERLANIPRAVVNVIGSSVATVVIAKWEGAFDREQSRIAFNQADTSTGVHQKS